MFDYKKASKNEKPVHEVCLDGFYMGKYEVTQGEWTEVMGSNPSKFFGEKLPVEMVSWEDAQGFIAKLNDKSGIQYRLPTEAEWEYAARSGGKKGKYAGTSSETDLGKYAWYDKNSVMTTHPVGQKKPNGLGLYDMNGNVWEWCSDWFSESTYDDDYIRDRLRNPQGASNGNTRVLRGGSWNFSEWYARTSARLYYVPADRYGSSGFRFVHPSIQ